jgi:hypothetical protein
VVRIALRAWSCEDEIYLRVTRHAEADPVVSPLILVERREQSAHSRRSFEHVRDKDNEIDVFGVETIDRSAAGEKDLRLRDQPRDLLPVRVDYLVRQRS